MIGFVRFFWLAYKVYAKAKVTGTNYAALTHRGVPQIACFVGVGREAWRVTEFAIEVKQRGQ